MWSDLQRFMDRLDQLRRFLDVAEQITLGKTHHWVGAEREARGSAIIGSMAELESLVSVVIAFVNRQINATSLREGQLIASLRPLSYHSTFVSLSSLRDPKKVWQHRESVTRVEMSLEAAALPVLSSRGFEPQPPLDGKTLKPEHFERIARLYGIGLSSFLDTAGKLSLVKLSDARNDLAHGNVPFGQVFSNSGFTTKEIRSDVDHIEQLGWNLVDSFDRYLASGAYSTV